ncbi:hypothetical protein FRD01_18315 [Microvenator marinus]|jgi:hypothetical protein|uniref:Transmembrane protein n=1 Tax=Microvenator marinus TaxID=2600177 RepID=A0A5B8XU54_9DELT|nr:hypothetical protein [Microvenator marinus]QED29160.1 hypothetical protein FRD01_18315 [Microvenator marinus]
MNNDDAKREELETQLKEGTGHVKFGVGVGAVSAASLLILGTTCPLCYFVAPAMVAAGVHKRRKAKQELEKMPGIKVNWPEELA